MSLCAVQLWAQNDEHEPFFKTNKFESDAFVQFDGSVTKLAENAAMVTGFGLNWLINHKVYLGVSYYKLTTRENVSALLEPVAAERVNVDHQSTGLKIGYIVNPENRFNFSPDIFVGWGNAIYEFPTHRVFRWNFTVLQPCLNGIVNANEVFRVGFGIGYRKTFGLNLNGLDDSHLSGISGSVFLRIGMF